MASDKSKKMVPATQVTDADEKKKALNVALAGIEKQFGKGAVIRMGDKGLINVEVISTGCLDLDIALGVGGLPAAVAQVLHAVAGELLGGGGAVV